jgi:hypothetical protein
MPEYWYAAAISVAATPAPISHSSSFRRFMSLLLLTCA